MTDLLLLNNDGEEPKMHHITTSTASTVTTTRAAHVKTPWIECNIADLPPIRGIVLSARGLDAREESFYCTVCEKLIPNEEQDHFYELHGEHISEALMEANAVPVLPEYFTDEDGLEEVWG